MKKLAITITAILASSAVYAENDATVTFQTALRDDVRIEQTSPNTIPNFWGFRDGNDATVTMTQSSDNKVRIDQSGSFNQAEVEVNGGTFNKINVTQTDYTRGGYNETDVYVGKYSDENKIDVTQKTASSNEVDVDVYWGSDLNDIDITQNEDNFAQIDAYLSDNNRIFIDQQTIGSSSTVTLNDSDNNRFYITQTADDIATISATSSNLNYVSITQY